MGRYVEQQQYLEEENEISLGDILRILRKRKWWIIITFLLAVSGVMFYLYTATPIYSSSATLWIEPSSGSSTIGDIFSLQAASGSTKIATEVEIIKSRRNLEKLIRRLDLVETYQQRYDYETPLTIERLVNSLNSSISVSTVKDTNIVRITAEHDDYFLARDIVNTLAEVFNELLKDLAQTEFSVRREFIGSQIEPTLREVETAEDELRHFKETNGVYLLDEEARNLLEIVSRYEMQIDPYLLQRDEAIQKQGVYAQMIRDEGGVIHGYEPLLSDPEIIEKTASLTDTMLELVGYSSQADALTSSTRVQELTSRSTRLESEIRARVQEMVLTTAAEARQLTPYLRSLYSQLSGAYVLHLLADVNISYLQRLKDSYEKKLNDLPRLEQEFIQLERELRVKENLYLLLLQNFEEARLVEEAVLGTSRIIDEAVADNRPIKPNKRMLLAVGALLGMFLGALIAFLIEAIDDSIKDEDTVKRCVGEHVPIVGRIPHQQRNPKDAFRELFVYNDPISPDAEAYKHISTNLLYSSIKKPQIVCFSSSEPGAGKTSSSANTAVAMAQNGLKTLLLDVDLRKPRLEEAFDLDRSTDGLVNHMLMDRDLADLVIQPLDDLPLLHLLPVGPVPPNPTSLITSDKFKSVLSILREYYDQIIIDLPPLMAASDALIISRFSDGLVIVIRSGSTSRRALKFTVESIQNTGVTILGVVENDLTKEHTTGYSYYNYYSHEDKKDKQKKNGSKSKKKKKSTGTMIHKNGSSVVKRTAKKAFDTQQESDDEPVVRQDAEPGETSEKKRGSGKSVLTKSSIDFLSEIESEEIRKGDDDKETT
jgi:capsular exopolysaccharide synthesis family protein